MKKILISFLLVLMTACATSNRQEPVNIYDADFKSVFQTALSTLKDRKFTIKTYDWNAGEIEAHLRYQERSAWKEVRTTVALEQSGARVKVRMLTRAAEDSAPISGSELAAVENAFLDALDKAMAGLGSK